MLGRYWQALVDRLDRPGRRALLVVPGSLWVSLSYRTPCLVYWRDGAWIHHARGAKIPHATLGRAAPPDVFTAQARELFLYGYTPRPGDVVFDVGAGIGAEALLFSQLVGGSGRVVSLVSFEAHYVPGLDRGLAVQNVVEEALERIPPFRPLLSYNFAVA
jgi:hypothetical protein